MEIAPDSHSIQASRAANVREEQSRRQVNTLRNVLEICVVFSDRLHTANFLAPKLSSLFRQGFEP